MNPIAAAPLHRFPSDADTKVAIVIVTYNAPEFVALCLDSIRHYSTMPCEIIVVDNASEEPLREYLRQQTDIHLILNTENKLWCEGSNQGIRAAAADCTHILLFNSDMEVRRADWLQRLVNLLESSPRIGLVGTAHAATRVWPTFGGVDGQCLMIRKKVLDEIGLLDSARYPWNGGDIDLAARAFKKGYIYKIMPEQPELVVHYRGMSRRKKSVARVNQELRRRDDRSREIVRTAGVPGWKLPRFAWQIFKHLPGQPFYELTKREVKITEGKLQ
jgi:GT2 family glycosyltransferase